jgi:hypothetical protein
VKADPIVKILRREREETAHRVRRNIVVERERHRPFVGDHRHVAQRLDPHDHRPVRRALPLVLAQFDDQRRADEILAGRVLGDGVEDKRPAGRSLRQQRADIDGLLRIQHDRRLGVDRAVGEIRQHEVHLDALRGFHGHVDRLVGLIPALGRHEDGEEEHEIGRGVHGSESPACGVKLDD